MYGVSPIAVPNAVIHPDPTPQPTHLFRTRPHTDAHGRCIGPDSPPGERCVPCSGKAKRGAWVRKARLIFVGHNNFLDCTREVINLLSPQASDLFWGRTACGAARTEHAPHDTLTTSAVTVELNLYSWEQRGENFVGQFLSQTSMLSPACLAPRPPPSPWCRTSLRARSRSPRRPARATLSRAPPPGTGISPPGHYRFGGQCLRCLIAPTRVRGQITFQAHLYPRGPRAAPAGRPARCEQGCWGP